MRVEELVDLDARATVGESDSCDRIVAHALTTCPGLDQAISFSDSLCIDVIRRRLVTETIGLRTYLYQEVDSTNAVLRRLAEAGAPEGTVVLAEAQYAGQGRRGARWFSPAGVNLYASVLFRPAIEPSAVPVFSFISSLALSDAIWAEGIPAAIKWPNDVVIEGRKVAGSFGAFATAGDRVDYVVLGTGVNLNVELPAPEQGLGPMAAGATSIRQEAGRPIDRNGFAATYLNSLEEWFNVYRIWGPTGVLGAWRARDALAGRWVTVRDEGAGCEGRVLGANRQGQLIVQEASGTLHRIGAGEITIWA